MRINLKEKIEWAKFWCAVIWWPLLVLFVLWIIEAILLRYFEPAFIPYLAFYFVFLFISLIIAYFCFIVDTKFDCRCIHCEKIYPEEDLIDLVTKEAESAYICNKCLNKLKVKK